MTTQNRTITHAKNKSVSMISPTCENCHLSPTREFPLITYYVDFNPKNHDPHNIIRLCPSCFRCFISTNPNGLTPRHGLYAFAINRGLYRHPKPEVPKCKGTGTAMNVATKQEARIAPVGAEDISTERRARHTAKK